MQSATRPIRGLVLGLSLGLGFLAFCLWRVWRELEIEFAQNKVTASLLHRGEVGEVLAGQLLAFALAAIALHLLLGCSAWGLARLSETAFPERLAGCRRRLVTAWAALLAGLTLIANASWFPASRFADEHSWLLASWHGLQAVDVVLALLGGAVLAMGLRALIHIRLRRRPGKGIAVALAALVLAAVGQLTWGLAGSPQATAVPAAPHVVILGIDSMRDDLAGQTGAERASPNLDEFLSGAQRFTDTISPLARTYPAMTAVLTGRHPVSVNARFNLMPRALVREGETLPETLQAHGYRTVYATDEVRFANFDRSYGFQQLVTPPIGAVDFVLGKAGDLPLVNLVTQLPVADWLFPSNRSNRAAYVTYRPEQFTRRLRRELVVDGPGFYLIHLTLAHWPFSWAAQSKPSTPPEYRVAYRRAIAEVDRQFAEVMHILRDKGVLENAIVIVLSDHGEALGGPTDTMLRQVGTAREIWDSIWGHGTSVMSPHQYGVLLAVRGFGHAAVPGAPAVHTWPVALEDIRPTVEELATGVAPPGVDGMSLVPSLRQGRPAADLAARIRFTETGFNTPSVLAGKFTESGLVHEAASYYELDAASGWIQIRQERLPELMARKQRAALTSDRLLAAIPGREPGATSYLLSERRAPFPRRLDGRPDPDRDPEAARLWDALHARFAGELPPHPPGPAM